MPPSWGFSRKVPPLPQKRIHRLQLLHIGIPRAGLLKELGGAAGEGVRILDVAVEQQGGVEKALDHFGKLRIVWIGLRPGKRGRPDCPRAGGTRGRP